MIWVYAATIRAARAWAREQHLNPLDYRATSRSLTHLVGTEQYRPGDRIVLVGGEDGVGDRIRLLVMNRRRMVSPPVPVIEV